MRGAKVSRHGFTLVQISILLTIASLVMVNTLPSTRSKLTSDNSSQTKLTNVMFALRQYQAANAKLPCPADASQPIGGASYGVAAANGGSATNCTGGAPAANYTDSTNHVAIGMVPVRALQLPNDAALDGYGRDITYAVDTNATGCWATNSLTGQITVTDNGTPATTVVALVSHGLDGHGAWIPMPGGAGSAVRLNTGSTDTDQLTNAHVDSSFNPTATLTNFVNKPVTTTFDDLVVYKSPQYTMNSLPAAVAVTLNGVTGPANGTYITGNVLSFTAVYSKPVTVTGTPYLSLSAITGSIGAGNVAQATYQSGSGTTSLTFSYTVAAADEAPTGITLASPIVLNGGTISPCAPTTFTPPNLSGVIIRNYIYVADGYNNRVQVLDMSGNFVMGLGAGYNGIAGPIGTSSPANGKMGTATGIAVDPSGNIWVADGYHDRVEKYNSSGTWLMQLGCGGSGSCADGSANGMFHTATNVNSDASGNIYVCDYSNYRVQKFNNAGTYQFSIGAGYQGIAGTVGTSGALPGQFNTCTGIVSDASGNIWVGDYGNNRVQEFNSSGTYLRKTTSAVSNPMGVALDGAGNLWTSSDNAVGIKEWNSSTGVKIANSPIASGFAQTKNSDAHAIAFDGNGNLWIDDLVGNRVQEFNSTGTFLQNFPTSGCTYSANPACPASLASGNFNNPQSLTFSR